MQMSTFRNPRVRLLLAAGVGVTAFTLAWQLYRLLSRRRRVKPAGAPAVTGPLEPIVYLNGRYLPESLAYIPATDRGRSSRVLGSEAIIRPGAAGFHFGDGVFAAIAVVDGVVELFGKHMQHLQEDADALRIKIPTIGADVVKGLVRLCVCRLPLLSLYPPAHVLTVLC